MKSFRKTLQTFWQAETSAGMEPRKLMGKLEQLLNKMKKESPLIFSLFLEPVDTSQFPLYPRIIHHPVDLATLKKQLRKGMYNSPQALGAQLQLMFQNALIFNAPPEGELYMGIHKLWCYFKETFETVFGTVVPQAEHKCLSGNRAESDPEYPELSEEEKSDPQKQSELVKGVLSKMESKFDEYMSSFRYLYLPADVPGYYEEISVPLSLAIVQSKLFWGGYGSDVFKGFVDDMRTIWRNGVAYYTSRNQELAKTSWRLASKFEKYLAKACQKQAPRIRVSLGGSQVSAVSEVNPKKQESVSKPPPIVSVRPTVSVSKPVVSLVSHKPTDSTRIKEHPPKQFASIGSNVIKSNSQGNSVAESSTTTSDTKSKKIPVPVDTKAKETVDSKEKETVDTKEKETVVLKEASNVNNEPAKTADKSTFTTEPDSSTSSPSKPPAESNELDVTQYKDIMLDIVDQLLKQEGGVFFSAPVTEEIAPGYFSIISTPMDLGTIRSNILEGYQQVYDFVHDLRLVWTNCRKYNHPKSPIIPICAALQKTSEILIRQHNLAPAGSKSRRRSKSRQSISTTTSNEPEVDRSMRKTFHRILSKLEQHPRAADFGLAFDPDLYGYQGYDEIIEKRMDLPLLRKNISNDVYENRSEFWQDLKRTFENALQYPGTPLPTQIAATLVLQEAKLLLDEFLPLPEHIVLRKQEWIPLAKRVLKYLRAKDPDNFFGTPVDPLFHGLYDYFKVIQHPVDLQTIGRKLAICNYKNKEEFHSDIRQVFLNCSQYHRGRETNSLANASDVLLDTFDGYWERLHDPTRQAAEKSDKQLGCLQITRKLMKLDKDYLFVLPVDVVSNPIYPTIVKNPMDLTTVEKKLVAHEYNDADAWKADIRQIWENCRLFNQEGSQVGLQGIAFSKKFDEYLSKTTPEALQDSLVKAKERAEKAQKRKDRPSISSSSAHKRVKLSYPLPKALPGALTYSLRPDLSPDERQLIYDFIGQREQDYLRHGSGLKTLSQQSTEETSRSEAKSQTDSQVFTSRIGLRAPLKFNSRKSKPRLVQTWPVYSEKRHEEFIHEMPKQSNSNSDEKEKENLRLNSSHFDEIIPIPSTNRSDTNGYQICSSHSFPGPFDGQIDHALITIVCSKPTNLEIKGCQLPPSERSRAFSLMEHLQKIQTLSQLSEEELVYTPLSEVCAVVQYQTLQSSVSQPSFGRDFEWSGLFWWRLEKSRDKVMFELIALKDSIRVFLGGNKIL